MAKELQQKLDSARDYASLCNNQSNKTKQKEFVLLTRTSSKGYSYPVKQVQGNDSKKKKREKVLTHEDGKRVRYFDDDDKYSLKSMVSVLMELYNLMSIIKLLLENFCFSLKKKLLVRQKTVIWSL